MSSSNRRSEPTRRAAPAARLNRPAAQRIGAAAGTLAVIAGVLFAGGSRGTPASDAGTAGAAPGAIALGDSIVRVVPAAGAADTVAIVLQAGAVVDLAAVQPPGSPLLPRLTLVDPHGQLLESAAATRTEPEAGIIGSRTITTTGTHLLIVDARCCSVAGAYILKARAAGALLTLTPGAAQLRTVRAGAAQPVVDTVSVVNTGTAATSFTVTAGGASWISVSPASGVAAPGATVQVIVTRSAAALPSEVYAAPLRVTPGDRWGGVTQSTLFLRAWHPNVTTVVGAAAGSPGEFGVLSPTHGLLQLDTRLLRVDLASGAGGEVAAGLPNVGLLRYLVPEADGGATAFDVNARQVIRIGADGSRTNLLSTGTAAQGLTAGAGSAYFVRLGAAVWRIESGTAPRALGAFRSAGTWLAYNAEDGYLYGILADQTLQRMHAVAGTVQDVTMLPTTVLAAALGASGRIYIAENNIYGGIRVFGPAGQELARFIMPAVGYGLELGNNTLFATGFTPPGARGLFRIPVADAPMPRVPASALWGDATRTGAVNAADALVCLSQVVSRAAGLADTSACDVAPDGAGGAYTGQVTAQDALVMLAHAVGRDVSAFRVARLRP